MFCTDEDQYEYEFVDDLRIRSVLSGNLLTIPLRFVERALDEVITNITIMQQLTQKKSIPEPWS